MNTALEHHTLLIRHDMLGSQCGPPQTSRRKKKALSRQQKTMREKRSNHNSRESRANLTRKGPFPSIAGGVWVWADERCHLGNRGPSHMACRAWWGSRSPSPPTRRETIMTQMPSLVAGE